MINKIKLICKIKINRKMKIITIIKLILIWDQIRKMMNFIRFKKVLKMRK